MRGPSHQAFLGIHRRQASNTGTQGRDACESRQNQGCSQGMNAVRSFNFKTFRHHCWGKDHVSDQERVRTQEEVDSRRIRVKGGDGCSRKNLSIKKKA